MTITAAQANAQITSNMTVDQIRAIINQVDANPNAGTVLLYNGGVGNIVGVDPTGNPIMSYSSVDIAEALSDASGVVSGSTDTRAVKTIFDTEVGKLLDNDGSALSIDFRSKLSQAIINDPAYQGRNIEQVLKGRDANGNYIADGFWDDGSRNLINQHNGDFRIIAPNSIDASTLNQIEIPALLEKSGSPSQKINSINLQDWQQAHEATVFVETAKNLANGQTLSQAQANAHATADQDIRDLVRKTSAVDLADTVLGREGAGTLFPTAFDLEGKVTEIMLKWADAENIHRVANDNEQMECLDVRRKKIA